MILSGKEILKEREKGNIIITPFNEKQLNPNSYNLKLDNELMIYDCAKHIKMVKEQGLFSPSFTVMEPIDMRKDNPVEKITIPDEGMIIYPGILYLGKTVEFTETHKFLPCIEGRSSIGRLGINIHITAGFGDVGFAGRWVVEISCVQPVRIYPFTEICQIYYQEVKGEVEEYKGHYQNQNDIIPSRLFMNDK